MVVFVFDIRLCDNSIDEGRNISINDSINRLLYVGKSTNDSLQAAVQQQYTTVWCYSSTMLRRSRRVLIFLLNTVLLTVLSKEKQRQEKNSLQGNPTVLHEKRDL